MAKSKAIQPTTKFTRRFGADFLEQFGPYVEAMWSVHPLQKDELLRGSKVVPPAVGGFLLLDTGAQRTCISQEAARLLELPVLSRSKCYGAGGQHENDEVAARLHITIVGKSTTQIWWDLKVQAVPELHRHPQVHGLQINGAPARLIGLLGRDILRRASVMYNGKTGILEVAFDRDWVKEQSVAAPPK